MFLHSFLTSTLQKIPDSLTATLGPSHLTRPPPVPLPPKVRAVAQDTGNIPDARCWSLARAQPLVPLSGPTSPRVSAPSVSVAFFSTCRSPQTLGLIRGPAPCPLGPSPACQLVWCVASEPGCGCVCPGGVFTLQTLPDLPGATQEWSVPAALSEAKGMVVLKQ